MDNQCKCRIGLYTGLCMLLFDGTLHHVDAQGAAKTAAVSDSRLVTMTECEGVDNCTTWSFSGIQGTAKSKTGEVFASLLVEKTSGNMITIKRADTEGSKAGLTAIYTGTVKGNRLSGEYKASWPGHGADSEVEGDWYAIAGPPPVDLPTIMHFCDVNCTTLQLKNGRYESVQNNNRYDPNWTDIWTVERFTPESVILHRTETGNFPFSNVIVKGQMSPDRNSLVNAVNPFHGQGQPETISLAWGSALNTVPRSNVERNRAITTTPSSGQATLEDLNQVLTMIEILQRFNALLSDNK